MNDRTVLTKFKSHFKNLNYYSMPESILFIVRKRLNFVFNFLLLIFVLIYTLI